MPLGWGVFALAIAATLAAPNTYYLFILGMIGVTTLVSVGLNVLAGLSGQISIGHAGFFAMGAYTGSLLMLKAQWHFGLAFVMAAIVAAGTGVALAAPALRVSGPYLAMVTIAFGVIVERGFNRVGWANRGIWRPHWHSQAYPVGVAASPAR